MALFQNTSKIGCYELELEIYNLIYTFLFKKTTNGLKRDDPGYYYTMRLTWNLKALLYFKCVLKMWRKDIFICHKCVERQNIVGHRCFR